MTWRFCCPFPFVLALWELLEGSKALSQLPVHICCKHCDPLPEPGLKRKKAEGSSRERELCIMGAGMRRKGAAVSSSEKGEELVKGQQRLRVHHQAKESKAEKSWGLKRKLSTPEKDISASPLSNSVLPCSYTPCHELSTS